MKQQIARCAGTDQPSLDLVIDGCTVVLQSRRQAWAFNNRAAAYYLKREYDRAIADCTEAIRLDPKLAKAFKVRGLAYLAKRDYDLVIADSTEAIRLDAKDPTLFNNRAAAYHGKGDNDRAIADATEAIRLDRKVLRPTPIAATRTAPRATSTALLPTTIRRSSLRQNMPTLFSIAGSRTFMPARFPRRSPTWIRRTRWLPKTPMQRSGSISWINAAVCRAGSRKR